MVAVEVAGCEKRWWDPRRREGWWWRWWEDYASVGVFVFEGEADGDGVDACEVVLDGVEAESLCSSEPAEALEKNAEFLGFADRLVFTPVFDLFSAHLLALNSR